MLEQILKKLGCKSIGEFVKKERDFSSRFAGMEVERQNPFFVLTDEEMDCFEKHILPTLPRE